MKKRKGTQKVDNPSKRSQTKLKSKTIVKKVSSKVKSSTKKKPVVNKQVSVKSSKNSVTKNTVVKRKRISKVGKKKEGDEVELPSNISPRLISKSSALRSSLDEYIHKSIYRIAYVSAFCFLLVGSSFTFANFLTENNLSTTLSAQLIGSTSDDGLNTQSLLDDEQLLEPPIFTFLNDIPDNITNDTEQRVLFEASNISHLQAKVVSISDSTILQVSYEELSPNRYRTSIPSEQLMEGYYELRVSFIANDGSGEKVHSTRKFFVGTEEAENDYNYPTHEDSGSTTTNSSTADGVNTDSIDTETLVNDDHNDDQEQYEEIDIDTEDDVKEPVVDKYVEEIEEPINDNTVLNNDEKSFELLKPNLPVLSDTAVLQILASSDYQFQFIELYARPLHAKEYRFVTLATKRSDGWKFIVNTINLPNGSYEFRAQTKNGSEALKTTPITLTVFNKIVMYEQDTDDGIKLESEINKEETVDRDFYEPVNLLAEPGTTFTNNVERETNTILKDNEIEIRNLLQRYAVALQSGDQLLIDTVIKELTGTKNKIILNTLQDHETREISDDIEKEFEKKIESLQVKILNFEEIRKEKSGGRSSIDTDGDGVSDFDEEHIYKTDHTQADSDNDGVNDGVEIVKGFSPLDDTPEAVIEFESPRESLGLERPDVLTVETVVPIVAEGDVIGDIVTIKTEIRGKALPNSFVTLYIFSSPTVVTIKTDLDGSFVYTYDKELEDGSHDVYIAVTDNTGSIIAQSKPFSFVKEAQAFSPIDSKADIVTVSTVNTDNSFSNYNTVLGLAVISLGIILLMLGVSLRTKKPDLVTVKSNLNSEEVTNDNSVIKEGIRNSEEFS